MRKKINVARRRLKKFAIKILLESLQALFKKCNDFYILLETIFDILVTSGALASPRPTKKISVSVCLGVEKIFKKINRIMDPNITFEDSTDHGS